MRVLQRSMAPASAVVVWISLSSCPGRADEAVAKAELPYQVREILQRRCLDCHGDAAKGGIKLFDRSLLVQQRQVVRPGSPETSELFDLVAGGSMPPGSRPKVPAEEQAALRNWIRAGAPSLPGDRDEAYVLWSIVRDFRARPDKEKPFVRYLSLNHLAGQDGALLKREREALRDVFHYLTAEGKQLPELHPIESTGTVYRIDLQELGWNRPPYPNEQLNLFDLALLEYPFGQLPIRSPFYPELYRFLDAAKQVRPITYLRADWLTRELIRPHLRADFLQVLGKLPDSKPPQTVQSLPILSAPTNAAGNIVPLDGLGYHAKPNADIDFRSIDFEQPMNDEPPNKDTFAPGDRMSLWIKSKGGSVFEIIHTDKNGQKTISNIETKEVEAGKGLKLGSIKMGLEENEQQDSEKYTIYAYPRDDLKAKNAIFPNGKLLKAKGIHDRVIHPLYKLPRPDERDFGLPKMVIATITVKTQRK